MKKVGHRGIVIAGALCVVAAGFWLIADQEPAKHDVATAKLPTHVESKPMMKPVSPKTKPVEILETLDFSGPLSEEKADFPEKTPRAEFLEKAPSLEGSEIAGRLAADDNNNLVMSFEVRDFFDYYLSAIGEASLQEIVQEINGYASVHLPEPAAKQATKVLEQYVTFKVKSVGQIKLMEEQFTQQPPEYHLDTLRNRVAHLKALRREIMAPETVEAFFSEEEQVAEKTIQMMEIQINEAYTLKEKTALLQRL